MLYSVIICIAYIIGILWGLYLDFYLGIVLFFLFICVNLFIRLPKSLVLLVITFYLLGFFIVSYRLNDFSTRYSNRFFLY